MTQGCARRMASIKPVGFPEGAHAYREILAENPKNFAALRYLVCGSPNQLFSGRGASSWRGFHASALHQLGRRAEAIASLERLLALNPDNATSWNNRGNMLLETGRVAEARQSYERAIRLQPDYPEAWHNLAVAKIRTADDRGARTDLDRALLLKPLDADALEHHGSVWVALQNSQKDS